MKQNLAGALLGRCGDKWATEVLKLVSHHPETQADMVLHVCNCYSQHGRSNCSGFFGNGDRVNWAGRHQVSIVKFTVPPNFVFIGKFA
jgi:hypothetical protein